MSKIIIIIFKKTTVYDKDFKNIQFRLKYEGKENKRPKERSFWLRETEQMMQV